MSEKSRQHRKVREEKQEKQARKVVNWIFGVLVFLAVCFAVYSMVLVS